MPVILEHREDGIRVGAHDPVSDADLAEAHIDTPISRAAGEPCAGSPAAVT